MPHEKIHESAFLQANFFIGGVISSIFTLGLLLMHIWYKDLLKPPGGLIAGQIAAQFSIDFSLIYTLFFVWANGEMVYTPFCYYVGIFAIYGATCSALYLLALSVEVYWKVRRPLNMNYKARSRVYHGVCHGYSAIAVIFAMIVDAPGLSALEACSVNNDSWYLMVFIIPWMIVLLASIIITLIAIRFVTGHKRYVWRYVIHSFIIFGWKIGVNIVFILELYDICPGLFHNIFATIATWTGILLCSWRLIEVTWLKKYFSEQKRNYGKLTRALSESSDTSLVPLLPLINQNFYANLYVDAVMNSLLGLELVFLLSSQICINDQTQFWKQDKIIHKFGKEDAANLGYGDWIGEWIENNLKFKITEYLPAIFCWFRHRDGLSFEDISPSLCPASNLDYVFKNAENKGGRGGSFFYFTHDRKFIIKSITSEELGLLTGSLCKNLHEHSVNHPNSCITRIYGVFSVAIGGTNAIHVILMGNCIPSEAQIIGLFDIKGSVKDRQVSDKDLHRLSIDTIDSGEVYKDIDFDKSFATIILHNSKQVRKALEVDALLFSKHNIMDYSLLLVICEKNEDLQGLFVHQGPDYTVIIGIIDFLQEFNFKKKIETLSKTIRANA